MPSSFEWDVSKAEINLRKHAVPFEYATLVFSDIHRCDWIDDRNDYKEERRITIGYVHGRLITVVYTERNEQTIRLISARKATHYEQKRYFEKI